MRPQEIYQSCDMHHPSLAQVSVSLLSGWDARRLHQGLHFGSRLRSWRCRKAVVLGISDANSKDGEDVLELVRLTSVPSHRSVHACQTAPPSAYGDRLGVGEADVDAGTVAEA